ncbi:MAG: hypothetical protein JXL67_10375 [Calditrichaeota bacterium]|nr:hypothetical protein [Calditrichota bacterium]RQV92525.1 MAG: hypothetical protein EH221_11305 [bacterium]
MEYTRDGAGRLSAFLDNWTKAESEELVLIYLEDYYKTMDDSYLKEALQIAKDERLDLQKILHRAKSRMS